MGSDMTVALAPATAEGRTFLGHDNYRPAGEGQSLVCRAGRDYTPGEELVLGSGGPAGIHLPQPRHTGTVLAARSGSEWGYRVGVNDRGVAVGLGTIPTRLPQAGETLTGPDLVRLALERGTTARQTTELIGELITRFGQCCGNDEGDGAEGGRDATFLVADGREAFVLEACGHHWALQVVGRVKAITPAALLRQDWDRISRGLADLAIDRGWWPADGCKLDFGGALGRPGPGHADSLRRWGLATVRLEQPTVPGPGQLDGLAMRRLMRDLAEDAHASGASLGWSFLIELPADPADLPVAWCAFGPPTTAVYFPLVPAGDLPAALTDSTGAGCRLWHQAGTWDQLGRGDARHRAAVRVGLAGLQERLDLNARDFLPEARGLFRRGEADLGRLATSFLTFNLERLDEVEARLRSVAGVPDGAPLAPQRPHPRTREEEYEAVGAGDF